MDTGLLFGGGRLAPRGRHMKKMCYNMHTVRAHSMIITAFRDYQPGRKKTLPNFWQLIDKEQSINGNLILQIPQLTQFGSPYMNI